MTALEIEAKRAQLARSILSIDSEEILEELSITLKNLTAKMPCRHSIDEIRAGADRVTLAWKSGDMSQFTPHEMVEKRRTL